VKLVNCDISNYGFCCYCKGCGKVIGDMGNEAEPRFADLDGEPFKAYYCVPCANKLRVTPAVTEPALLSAGRLLYEISGTCPADMFQWEHPEGCEDTCADGIPPTCWAMYASIKKEKT